MDLMPAGSSPADASLVIVSPVPSGQMLAVSAATHVGQRGTSIQLELACDELQAASTNCNAEHLQAGIRNLVKHMAGAPRATDLDQVRQAAECEPTGRVANWIMTGLFTNLCRPGYLS